MSRVRGCLRRSGYPNAVKEIGWFPVQGVVLSGTQPVAE